MAFEFSQENLAKILNILKKYPEKNKASTVLPLLDLAQRQNNGWLNQEALETVAKFLDMPEMRVYEIASFYSMFNLNPVGKYHVQVCGTTPCMLRGSEEIIKSCQEHKDEGLFTVSEVECLGACANAPVMQINDDFFEDLTVESTKSIIDDLRSGKKPKVGSQIGRQCSKAKSC